MRVLLILLLALSASPVQAADGFGGLRWGSSVRAVEVNLGATALDPVPADLPDELTVDLQAVFERTGVTWGELVPVRYGVTSDGLSWASMRFDPEGGEERFEALVARIGAELGAPLELELHDGVALARWPHGHYRLTLDPAGGLTLVVRPSESGAAALVSPGGGPADPNPPPVGVGARIRRCDAMVGPLPDAIALATQATVQVETVRGSGSGVIVSPDGFVLTAAHVVGDATRPTVVLADGSRLGSQVVRRDPGTDLALLRADARRLPCAPVAVRRAPVGTDLYVIGSPWGELLTHSVSRGIVGGWREVVGVVVLQTDASINAGNSGGPIFDAEGRLQGIVSFKLVGEGVEGLGFGIGVEQAADSLGIAWARASDPRIEVALDRGALDGGEARSTGRPAGPFPHLEPAEVSPASAPRGCPPGLLVTGPTIDVEVRGGFEIEATWTGGPAKVRLSYPVGVGQGADLELIRAELGEPAFEAGGIVVQLELSDGSVLALASREAALERGVVPRLVATFWLEREHVALLAATPPTHQRWFIGDLAPLEQPRSSRQQLEHYQPVLGCLLQEMDAR